MAPIPVQDRYALYKSGTAKLVQWLANQAGRCCDLSATVTSVKNKAKLDKESTIDATLTTKEFVRLAQIIIASDTPKIVVPFCIVDLAREVIAGRQLCADWYECRDAPEHSKIGKANKRHKHFIGVLEKVYGLLRGAYYKAQGLTKKQYKKMEKAQQKTHSVGNLFAILHVEEPSESPLGDAPPPQSITSAPSKTTFRLEPPEDDTFLVVWCFLEDMKDVRGFIRTTWEQSRDGLISRLNASMITLWAFEMMYYLQEQLQVERVKLIGYSELLDYLDICVACEGTTIIAFPGDPAQGGHRGRRDSIADLICLAGYLTLRMLLKAKGESRMGHGDKVSLGSHDIAFPSQKNTHDFSQAVCSVVPEIFAMGREESPFLHADMFFDTISKILGAKSGHAGPIPIWMVIACESYMDVYEIVGDMAKEGLHELRAASQSIRSTLSKMKEFECKNINSTFTQWSPEPNFEKCFDSIKHFIEKDWFSDAVKEDPTITPYRLVSTFPLLPPLMHDHMRLRMHYLGLERCNDGAVVLTAAHLYSAARAQGIITKPWADMDFVISEQNKQIGDHRKIMVDYPPNASALITAKHFSIALGLKATEVGGRKPPFPHLNRVHSRSRKFGLTSAFLRMATKKAVVPDKKTTSGHVMGQVLHTLIEKEESLKSPTASNTSSTKAEKYHPCLKLSKLKASLEEDQNHVSFGYNEFFLHCLELLDTVAAHFALPSGRPHAKNFYDILWDAAQAELRSAPQESTLLFRVGRHLESLFVKDGNVGKRVSELMSGGFPHPRPAPSVPRSVFKMPIATSVSLEVSQRQGMSVCWLASGRIDEAMDILVSNATPLANEVVAPAFTFPQRKFEQQAREVMASYQKLFPKYGPML